ncbi:MAG: ArnT family glycosyltransferase [Egibacteraceae bacterium]
MASRSRLVLGLILLVGLGRGLFWAATIAVWNPIDEMQHFAYIASIAAGEGIPVVGADLLPDEVLLLAKDSRTYGFRPLPVRPTSQDPSWGASAQQYEGVQPPLYYALMAPLYSLARPWGLLATVMAVRVATLLVSLAAVPLTALLARELFPGRKAVWVGAPALLVTLGAVNGNVAYVTNDGLVLPLATGVLLVTARAWRRGPRIGQAALTGALGGLAFLTRANVIVLAPLVAAALVGAAWRHRASLASVAAWAGTAAGVGAALGLPWIVWTRLAYRSSSLAAEFAAIIGPIVGRQPRTIEGLISHFEDATRGWFDFEVLRPPLGAYFAAAASVCAVALLAGLVGCWRRREGAGALALVWLAASAPVAVLGMFGVIQLALGGEGGMVGRYLILTLPPLAVLVAAGLDALLGARWGAVAVAAVAAISVSGGARLERAYVSFVYTQQTTDEVAPVVDQSWHDAWAEVAAVDVLPPCPVQAITLTFAQAPPAAIAVETVQVPLQEAMPLSGGAMYGTYALPSPLASAFTVRLPDGVAVGVSGTDREAALALEEMPGDPVARLACAVEDPKATRFSQLHALAGIVPIGYGTLMAAPLLWPILGWAAVLWTALRGRGVSSPAALGARAPHAAATAPRTPGSRARDRWPPP